MTLLSGSTAISRHPRAPRAHAGDLLGLDALTADGLAVRTDGTYVRALSVVPVNPLVLPDAAADQVTAGVAAVNARLMRDESLQLYAQADPLPIENVIDRERRKTDQAISAASPDVARALGRAGACVAHSLRVNALALAAVQLRYVVLVPYRPPGRPARRRHGVRRLDRAGHEAAVQASVRLADAVREDLAVAGLRARPIDGPEWGDLIWSRTAPDLAYAGAAPPTVAARAAFGDPAHAASPTEADTLTRHLRETLAPQPISAENAVYLRVGGSVQRTVYLSNVPAHHWLGWLLNLMQTPLPFAISVHFHATDRHREKQRQAGRLRRMRAVGDGMRQRGQRPTPEAQRQEAEAEAAATDLALNASSGLYLTSVYITLIHPGGENYVQVLCEQVDGLLREARTIADARALPARFAQLTCWQAGLPLGSDPLYRRRARRQTADLAANTIPLVGTTCGSPVSPTAIPLGYAHPGRSLEYLDFYDPEHLNHLCVIFGKSGTGKTMLTNLIVLRALAQGAKGWLIDRAGHFEFLASLIPDSVPVRLGATGGGAINPWDTPEPAGVPNEKHTFLLALQGMLIGGERGELSELELSIVDVAIRRVYQRCATSGEQPRQTLLQEELRTLVNTERELSGDPSVISCASLLAQRMAHLVGDGTYAFMCDRPTSLPPDGGRLVVFDTRAVPDNLSAAVVFVISEHVQRVVEHRREAHLASNGQAGAWDGCYFLGFDELWKLLSQPRAADWIAELARRSRHLALSVIAMSQQLTDFDTPAGRAVLENASMRIFFRQEKKQLAAIAQAVELHESEISTIANLQTSKRRYSTIYLVNGERGRGKLSIRMGPLEYWICTSDPRNDEPVRRHALRETDGDPWAALQLLADPEWHEQRETA